MLQDTRGQPTILSTKHAGLEIGTNCLCKCFGFWHMYGLNFHLLCYIIYIIFLWLSMVIMVCKASVIEPLAGCYFEPWERSVGRSSMKFNAPLWSHDAIRNKLLLYYLLHQLDALVFFFQDFLQSFCIQCIYINLYKEFWPESKKKRKKNEQRKLWSWYKGLK